MGIMVRDRPSQESALMESGCRNFLHSGALQPEPQLPCGWEKCLDLKSGLIYYKDWNSGTMTYRDPRQRVRRVWMESSATETTTPSTTASLQITTDDEEQSLELSLNLPGSKSSGPAVAATSTKNLPVPPSSKNQEESVCTMEKVRLALDRLSKKRSVSSSRESNSPTTSDSSTSSECFTSPSVMSYEGDDEEVQQQPRQRRTAPAPSSKVAAVAVAPTEMKMSIVGCKSCLMYVMLSKSHPCCPKCGNTDVLLELPQAPVSKKQRTESSSPTTWSWCTA